MKKNNTYLSFKLNKELFAISVLKVLEVLQEKEVTVIPNTPKYVEGVINFRGEIIPVIQLRQKMNMPQRKENEKSVTIIMDLNINNSNTKIGVIVDGVSEVVTVSDKKIKEVPKIGSSFNVEFLNGMIKTENNFTMLLNIDKVFSEKEAKIISKINN